MNPTDSTNPKPGFDLFSTIADVSGSGKGWREVVKDLGVEAFAEVAGSGFYDLVDTVVAKQSGYAEVPDTARLAFELAKSAAETGALYGYCLGRLAPTGLEDLAGWTAQAWALSGLTVAQEKQPEPPTTV